MGLWYGTSMVVRMRMQATTKGPGQESLKALQHLGRSCERNGDTPQAQSGTTRDGTRAHNLLLRGEAPYPLGHTSNSHIFEGQICLLVGELS